MNAYEHLKEKLNNELKEFIDSYRAMEPIQIYNDWYIIGFYEEYFDMLSCDFLEKQGVKEIIEWLSGIDKPLAHLYDRWEKSEGAFSHDWNDMLNWVSSLYKKEMNISTNKSTLDSKLQDANARILNSSISDVQRDEIPIKDTAPER